MPTPRTTAAAKKAPARKTTTAKRATPARKAPQDRKAPTTRRRSAAAKPMDESALPPVTPGADALSTPVPDDKYAVTAWGGEYAEDLEMPSGQLALVRRPGLERLVEAGVIHQVDSLTAFVGEKHIKRVQGKITGVDAVAISEDPVAVDNMVHLVDRVVVHCVIKPRVEMTPNDITRRQAGVVYCDMIALEDRFFIFNYAVGGTRDIEQFRKSSAELVDSVGPQPSDGGEAV